MKKKYIIIGSIILILIIAIILIILYKNKDKQIYLENVYYSSKGIMDITKEDLKNLIDGKESFALLVYQPLCEASASFEEVVNEFLNETPITIYKISFQELEDSQLCKEIEHYPSFVIYDSGKVLSYLDANSNEDTTYYKSKDEFTNWFSKYVKLDKVNKDNVNSDNQNNSVDEEIEPSDEGAQTNLKLDDVVKEEGKVNIYFFWGDGCPICEKEIAFFDEIQEEYGQYYNLYTFETWHSEENQKIFTEFATAMGADTRGVPVTIIGNKVIVGFSESKKSELISAIEDGLENSFDVYFDKIVG